MFRIRSPRRPKGFTLIELMVVIALLMFLIGLLLPLLQWFRAQEGRTRSQNNLKQILLALHSCNDVHRKLPPAIGFFPGQVPPPGQDGWRKTRPAPHGTVFHHILPFIEQDNVYKNSEGMSRNTKGIVIEMYIAPLDFTVPANQLHAENQGAISYGANGYVLGGWTYGLDMIQGPGPHGKIQLAAIPDGTSNTIAMAERFSRCIDKVKRAGGQFTEIDYQRAWSEDGKGRTPHSPVVWKHDVLPQFNVAMKPGDGMEKPPCNPEAYQGFGNTIQVATFDGAVRTVSTRITPLTWSNAMRPDDGMPLGDDF